MKITHVMAGVIVILLICLCLLAGMIIAGDQGQGNEISPVQESVKETLNLSDSTLTEWDSIRRVSNSTDFSDFQEYIDAYNTTSELRNYHSGIVSLDDFLGPILSFVDENPTGADGIAVYKEYYKIHFAFEGDNEESAGNAEYKCYSPQECYELTNFMAGNQDLEEIFGGKCVPDYDEYEYFCYLECSYDSGEKAYAVFTNHQIVFYYQDDGLTDSFDTWFEGVPEFH